MNKISVIGRVSTDITTKEVNGRNVANFNVASQNKQPVGEENGRKVFGTNFYHVSAWGQAADTASRFLKKGHRVGIVGDLVIRKYTGTDGLEHVSVDINNAEIDLVETKAESDAKANTTSAAPAPAPAPAPAQGFTPVETDELPF